MHPLHSRALFLLGLFVLATTLPANDPAGTAPTSADRVGLPLDYRTAHTVIRHDFWSARNQVITVYANAAAASVTDLRQLPYPPGSLIVFEYAVPVKNTEGVPAREPDGNYQRGEVTRLDVMRREPGYGESYGDRRAGEWEFASYRPDGRPMELPEGAAACAQCHQKPGAGRDYVFRGRFPRVK